MKKILVFAAFTLAGTMSGGQIAYAQAPQAQGSPELRHAAGLALERRGDDAGAFIAFVEAAEAGHPPAQRKLGEIYDSGNTAVERDYQAAIHWYEKAREGGEEFPPPRAPYPTFIYLP
jgi:TPR repeat protein